MKALLCPIGVGGGNECRLDACAWWSEEAKRCAVALVSTGEALKGQLKEIETKVEDYEANIHELEKRVAEHLELLDQLQKENIELIDSLMGRPDKVQLMEQYMKEGRPFEDFMKAIGVVWDPQGARDQKIKDNRSEVKRLTEDLRRLEREIAESLAKLKAAPSG